MSVLVRSELCLEPTALAMREIGGWLGEAVARLPEGTAPGLLARAELAVHEACMNVVDHAHLPDGATIDLSLELRPDRLTVRVSDPGDEFPIADVGSPPAHTLQERGYGVKIIRSLVSELSYQRSGSRNELELRIDIGDQP